MKIKLDMSIVRSVGLSVVLMVFILTELSLSALLPGQMSAVRRNSKSTKECIDGFQRLLYDEIINPTKPHKGGGGGVIDHDYIMDQFITSFQRIVNSYNETTGKWENNTNALATLKVAIDEQKNSQARQIMQIALGLCGERYVIPDLIEVIHGSVGVDVRTSAISALAQLNAIEAIPEMIGLINDTTKSKYGKSCSIGNAHKAMFPVRRAARYALLHFQVDTMEHKKYEPSIDRWKEFTIDTNSAVQVLEKGLTNVSDDRNKNLLAAISRVGGELAKKSLEAYIEKNKLLPEKNSLVSEAKELLLKIEPVEMEAK